MNNKITITSKEIPLGDGIVLKRILYKVDGKICCFIDISPKSSTYRVSIGRPSDTDSVSFRYPKDEAGYKQALEKACDICNTTIVWNNTINP